MQFGTLQNGLKGFGESERIGVAKWKMNEW